METVPPHAIRVLAASRVAAVLCALTALVAACTDATTTISTTHTEPPLFVHNVRGGGDDAGIVGYLRYIDEAECFVIEPDYGDGRAVRNVAVWPPGTRPAHEGGELVGVDVPGVGAIALGDWVTGGGGYENLSTTDLDLPDVSPECLSDDGEFAFLHEISSAGPRPSE